VIQALPNAVHDARGNLVQTQNQTENDKKKKFKTKVFFEETKGLDWDSKGCPFKEPWCGCHQWKMGFTMFNCL
jgi:hypothetical protein